MIVGRAKFVVRARTFNFITRACAVNKEMMTSETSSHYARTVTRKRTGAVATNYLFDASSKRGFAEGSEVGFESDGFRNVGTLFGAQCNRKPLLETMCFSPAIVQLYFVENSGRRSPLRAVTTSSVPNCPPKLTPKSRCRRRFSCRYGQRSRAPTSANSLANRRTGNCCSIEPDLIEAADIEERFQIRAAEAVLVS